MCFYTQSSDDQYRKQQNNGINYEIQHLSQKQSLLNFVRDRVPDLTESFRFWFEIDDDDGKDALEECQKNNRQNWFDKNTAFGYGGAFPANTGRAYDEAINIF